MLIAKHDDNTQRLFSHNVLLIALSCLLLMILGVGLGCDPLISSDGATPDSPTPPPGISSVAPVCGDNFCSFNEFCECINDATDCRVCTEDCCQNTTPMVPETDPVCGDQICHIRELQDGSCAEDCENSTSEPSPPEPGPGPTIPGPTVPEPPTANLSCNDGVCSRDETCSTCVEDCGSCTVTLYVNMDGQAITCGEKFYAPEGVVSSSHCGALRGEYRKTKFKGFGLGGYCAPFVSDDDCKASVITKIKELFPQKNIFITKERPSETPYSMIVVAGESHPEDVIARSISTKCAQFQENSVGIVWSDTVYWKAFNSLGCTFGTLDYLVRVIAHEFAHTLGVPHNSGEITEEDSPSTHLMMKEPDDNFCSATWQNGNNVDSTGELCIGVGHNPYFVTDYLDELFDADDE